jgi:hypothetical protein
LCEGRDLNPVNASASVMPREKKAAPVDPNARAETHADVLARSLAQSLDRIRELTEEVRALRHERAGVVDLEDARRTRK